MLAAGGALAARLSSPPGALASLAGPPPPAMRERRLGTVAPGTRTVALARSADLLGLAWHGDAGAPVGLRFRSDDGRWSAWVSGAAAAHGPDRPPADRA